MGWSWAVPVCYLCFIYPVCTPKNFFLIKYIPKIWSRILLVHFHVICALNFFASFIVVPLSTLLFQNAILHCSIYLLMILVLLMRSLGSWTVLNSVAELVMLGKALSYYHSVIVLITIQNTVSIFFYIFLCIMSVFFCNVCTMEVKLHSF